MLVAMIYICQRVPISNWLALKMQIWILSLTSQHCVGVAIDNYYSLSTTEERYQALTPAIEDVNSW